MGFGGVRVHTSSEAAAVARSLRANAFTAGTNLFFASGQYAPGTVGGDRLLAHELTHVIQQTGKGGTRRDSGGRAALIQCKESTFTPTPDPGDLVDMYYMDMAVGRFGGIAQHLVLAIITHPAPSRYLIDVFKAIPSNWGDNVGAEFIKRLPNPYLDRLAASSQGRYALNVVYENIITGSVSEFEREQANRIIQSKLKRKSPEDYVKGALRRSTGAPTPIFPVRFMRVTGGDYAPPLAKLMPNGSVRVSYPVAVNYMRTFREEMRTLGNVFGEGMDLNPNEIVGIKDYERGGSVQYLPALVLIDYSNQAIQSTSGKIIEVAAFAATMGLGGGAVAGGRAAASELVTSTAIWGARLAKTAQVLDRAASVIEIASFVINENRDWIIGHLGSAGKRLVQLSDVASNAAAIYGLGRLAQGGYQIVKEMRAASKAARDQAKTLTAEQSRVLSRLDDETDLMIKELDDEAAKAGHAAAPAAGEKPAAGGHVEEPGAVTASSKATPAGPGRPAAKTSGVTEEIRASAKTAKISVEKLEAEVGDLRRKAANPDNVHKPKDSHYDAEMTAQGHRFERDKVSHTWCRRSERACRLDLGSRLNTDVDSAVAKREAKFAAIEQQRKAREALPPRTHEPKRQPAKAETHPTGGKSKVGLRARQQAERESTKKAIQSRIDDAKELELQLRSEIDELEQAGKQRLDASERGALASEKAQLESNLRNKIDERLKLRKALDEVQITPYDRARAFSYSDDAAEEVVGRARKVVEVPGQPKKLELVDEMSGRPVKSPSIDHVVSVDEIVLMDGWDKLHWPEQQAFLSRVDNLRVMEKGANSSKGNKRWKDWIEGKRIYGEKVWLDMVAEEERLRRAIQKSILEKLAARGQAA